MTGQAGKQTQRSAQVWLVRGPRDGRNAHAWLVSGLASGRKAVAGGGGNLSGGADIAPLTADREVPHLRLHGLIACGRRSAGGSREQELPTAVSRVRLSLTSWRIGKATRPPICSGEGRSSLIWKYASMLCLVAQQALFMIANGEPPAPLAASSQSEVPIGARARARSPRFGARPAPLLAFQTKPLRCCTPACCSHAVLH